MFFLIFKVDIIKKPFYEQLMYKHYVTNCKSITSKKNGKRIVKKGGHIVNIL
ncbi:MAG: hypothetical protein V3U15_04580 [Nitrospinota bacterium]